MADVKAPSVSGVTPDSLLLLLEVPEEGADPGEVSRLDCDLNVYSLTVVEGSFKKERVIGERIRALGFEADPNGHAFWLVVDFEIASPDVKFIELLWKDDVVWVDHVYAGPHIGDFRTQGKTRYTYRRPIVVPPPTVKAIPHWDEWEISGKP